MSAVSRVLIQGGGIGGLVAATALAQRGIAVDVVEHRPAGSVLGVGLNQPSNALRVMRGIGVLDECLYGDRYDAGSTGFSVWRISLPRPRELGDACDRAVDCKHACLTRMPRGDWAPERPCRGVVGSRPRRGVRRGRGAGAAGGGRVRS